MKALLAGYGGIGSAVYFPELKKLGYDIDILDERVLHSQFTDVSQIKKSYELAVICTPNFTHQEIAEHLADKGTKRIFVEKPGVESLQHWTQLNENFPDTQFKVVKNNLYRDNYGDVLKLFSEKKVIGVDFTWLNKNRIPNPGTWFTDKKFSFGGVSRDLMPHLYCFASKLFGIEKLSECEFIHSSYRRWDLSIITSTDYGHVYKDGVFDVDDYAMALGIIDNISVRLVASWKEGYDKQSITLFFEDGSSYEWMFGLCPTEAYGVMLQDTNPHIEIDNQLHYFLDCFSDD